ncbi:Uncharacterized protein GBIM_16900 [Gryllus bimaculatus]|nr:Uncharacterized protein GBIM_16900 [Gryllus bimaculatus]
MKMTNMVAWLRVDTQTILTIASHVITKNHRIAVTHSDHRTWFLHIRDVRETDRGWYMCQINTDPMKSQVGYLEVVGEYRGPPDWAKRCRSCVPIYSGTPQIRTKIPSSARVTEDQLQLMETSFSTGDGEARQLQLVSLSSRCQNRIKELVIARLRIPFGKEISELSVLMQLSTDGDINSCVLSLSSPFPPPSRPVSTCVLVSASVPVSILVANTAHPPPLASPSPITPVIASPCRCRMQHHDPNKRQHPVVMT